MSLTPRGSPGNLRALRLSERIAELYFRPWACEGPLYERLGVRPFQRLMVGIGRGHVRRQQRPSSYLLPSRTREGLVAFERRTRSNELVHLMGMVGPALALLVARPGPVVSVVLILVLVLNFYPWMLQRYNRIRLRRVLDRRISGRR